MSSEEATSISDLEYDVELYDNLLKSKIAVKMTSPLVIKALLCRLSKNVRHVEMTFTLEYEKTIIVMPHWDILIVDNWTHTPIKIDFSNSNLKILSISGHFIGHSPTVKILKLNNVVGEEFVCDGHELLDYCVNDEGNVSDELLSSCHYLTLCKSVDPTKINPKLLSLELQGVGLACNLPYLRRLVLNKSFCYLGYLSHLIYFDTDSGSPTITSKNLTYYKNRFSEIQGRTVNSNNIKYYECNNYETTNVPELYEPIEMDAPDEDVWDIIPKIIECIRYNVSFENGVAIYTPQKGIMGIEVYDINNYLYLLQTNYNIAHVRHNGDYYENAIKVNPDELMLRRYGEDDIEEVSKEGFVLLQDDIYVRDVNELKNIEVITIYKHDNSTVHLFNNGGCALVEHNELSDTIHMYHHGIVTSYHRINRVMGYMDDCVYTDHYIFENDTCYFRIIKDLNCRKYECPEFGRKVTITDVDYDKNEFTKLALDKKYEELKFRLGISKVILKKDMFGRDLLDLALEYKDIKLLEILVGFGVDYEDRCDPIMKKFLPVKPKKSVMQL